MNAFNQLTKKLDIKNFPIDFSNMGENAHVIALIDHINLTKAEIKASLEFASTLKTTHMLSNLSDLFYCDKANWSMNGSTRSIDNILFDAYAKVDQSGWDGLHSLWGFYHSPFFLDWDKLTSKKDNKPLAFTAENITKVFNAFNAEMNLETTKNKLIKYKDLFSFNRMQNGNLVIKFDRNAKNEFKNESQRRDFFALGVNHLGFIILTLIGDIKNPLMCQALNSLCFNEDGMQWVNNNGNYSIKLNKKYADQLMELIGF